jgi:gas vesicle protein
MKGFLTGLGIGLGLGVLFAPRSGEETREEITRRANDLAGQARDTFEQGRERVRSGISAVREGVREGVRAGYEQRTGTEGSNV